MELLAHRVRSALQDPLDRKVPLEMTELMVLLDRKVYRDQQEPTV
jgi:hypothetical protein